MSTLAEHARGDLCGRADAFEARADDVDGVLSGVQQHGARRGAGNRPREDTPVATLTAIDRARKDLQHFGSPPPTPTGCRA